ncbi:hypothetical protein D3C77_342360 [compost metagenome]
MDKAMITLLLYHIITIFVRWNSYFVVLQIFVEPYGERSKRKKDNGERKKEKGMRMNSE